MKRTAPPRPAATAAPTPAPVVAVASPVPVGASGDPLVPDASPSPTPLGGIAMSGGGGGSLGGWSSGSYADPPGSATVFILGSGHDTGPGTVAVGMVSAAAAVLALGLLGGDGRAASS